MDNDNTLQEMADERNDLLEILEAYVNEWEVAHAPEYMKYALGIYHEPLSLIMARAALERNRG